MIKRIFRRSKCEVAGLASSTLFNEKTFYVALQKDLSKCRNELVIESPFITGKRVASLLPELRRLRKRGATITINTRSPHEHDGYLKNEAEKGIELLHGIGAQVLFTGGHHRKLVIIDRRVLFEGSLNILSQNDSCEIMRRIESEELVSQMIYFTGLTRFLD